jgi:hypothetical protein
VFHCVTLSDCLGRCPQEFERLDVIGLAGLDEAGDAASGLRAFVLSVEQMVLSATGHCRVILSKLLPQCSPAFPCRAFPRR